MEENITSYVQGLKFKNEEEKSFYLDMAEQFEKGGENFYAYTPAQLSALSDCDVEGAWVRFLSNASIKAYIDKRMAIILDTVKRRSTLKYMDAVESGNVSSNDIKNITTIVNEENAKDNNMRVFVTRIPEKNNRVEELEIKQMKLTQELKQYLDSDVSSTKELAEKLLGILNSSEV